MQYHNTTQNANGEPVGSWATFHECWARVRPMSGNERVIASQIQAETTHAVELRYKAGITQDMRILFGTRILHIENIINPEEYNELQRLMCIEKY